MSKSRKFAYIALFLTSLLWGLAPPVIKYSLKFVTPVSFLFYRFTLACLIFAVPLIYKTIKTKPSVYEVGQYLLLGFLSTPLNLLLYFWGIDKTSAINASILAILSPIMIILGGVFFLREKVTKKESIGIIIAVIGTIILILAPYFGQKISFLSNLTGALLIIAGDIVWAVFTLLAKRIKNQRLDPFIISAFSFVVGWFVLLPLFLTEKANGFDTRALPGIIYMAVFSSVIAYSAYTYGLKKIEASEASVFTYLQPLFAIPAAVIFLGEKLTIYLVVGAILITLGVFVCESRPSSQS